MKLKKSICSVVVLALVIMIGCAPNMSNYVPRDKNLIFEPKAESVSVVKLPGVTKGTVKSDDFRQALIEGLRHSNLFSKILSEGSAQYELTADLLSHQNTAFGLDMTNSTIAHYILKNTESQKVVYEETITSSHTVTVSEACVGAKRDIKATEGSVQANIKKFIYNLSQTEF